jgi:hypothetical protein
MDATSSPETSCQGYRSDRSAPHGRSAAPSSIEPYGAARSNGFSGRELFRLIGCEGCARLFAGLAMPPVIFASQARMGDLLDGWRRSRSVRLWRLPEH